MEKFDKEKAREEFFKKHPSYHNKKSSAKKELKLSASSIGKIISLFSGTTNNMIANMLGISYNDFSLVIRMMRKSGIVLEKNKKGSKVEFIEKMIKEYGKKHE